MRCKKLFFGVVLILFSTSLLSAQVNFQYICTFNKPPTALYFEAIQLFEYDGDGIDEIITQYWDNNSGYEKLMIFNQFGNIIDTLDFIDVEVDYSKFILFDDNNFKKVIYAYPDDYENLLEIVIKDINNFTTIDSINFEPYAYWIVPYSFINCSHSDVTSFMLGYNRGFLDYSDTVMRRFDLVNDSLVFIEIFQECGLANMQVNDDNLLSIGWDSTFYPPNGGSVAFWLKQISFENVINELNAVSGTLYLEDTTNVYGNFPKNYEIITQNCLDNFTHVLQYRELDTYYGNSVHFKAYETTNWQEVWSKEDSQIGLEDITASSCVQVNDEDHYVMYFRGDKLEIRDRVTGDIIHHQDSVLAVCDILRKSDGELLFFVEKDDETGYDVYSLDGPIFVSNDEPPEPNGFFIEQFPNPFNNQITFSFSSKEPIQNAEIKIYNVKGQLIKTISSFLNPSLGTKNAEWDGRDENGNEVKQGIYFYQCTIKEKNYIGKIIKLH